jgi:hypothetical protein
MDSLLMDTYSTPLRAFRGPGLRLPYRTVSDRFSVHAHLLGYRQDPWLSILFCIFVALDTSKIWLAWIKRQAKGDSAREVKVTRKIITNPVCSSI